MLYQQLKNASKWVFKQLENAGKAMNEAEERLFSEDKDERN
jgi:hypothetical protein